MSRNGHSAQCRIYLLIIITGIAILISGSAGADDLWDIGFIYAPNMSFDYAGEGNNNPPSYTAEFSGMSQMMGGLEAIRTISEESRIGLFYLHGGTSSFSDESGTERVGEEQECDLNIGFSNFMVSYLKKVRGLDMEFMVNVSMVRMMFSRRNFMVNGEVYYDDINGEQFEKEDNNEISAEGVGFGIKGRFGDDLFVRYKAFANYYVEVHDMKTDNEAGEYFCYELTAGGKYGQITLEAGYMYHYIFLHSQTNRRVYLGENAPDGGVISWSQQDMTIKGGFVRMDVRF